MPNTALSSTELRALPVMIEIVADYSAADPIKTKDLLEKLGARGFRLAVRSIRKMAKAARKHRRVMILSRSSNGKGGYFTARNEHDAMEWRKEAQGRAFNILADVHTVERHFRPASPVRRVRVKRMEFQEELGI